MPQQQMMGMPQQQMMGMPQQQMMGMPQQQMMGMPQQQIGKPNTGGNNSTSSKNMKIDFLVKDCMVSVQGKSDMTIDKLIKNFKIKYAVMILKLINI